MEKLPLLIIVDFQYDFCEPSGALYVQGAEGVRAAIVRLLRSGTVGSVWFTADWHCATHPSFRAQGGMWPQHCVQHTRGAAIHQELIDACIERAIPYTVTTKGAYEEEYGAFSTLPPALLQAVEAGIPIYLCGLAGDYCVIETLKNIRALNPRLFMSGISSIDDGSTLARYMAEEGIAAVEE